jgi:hypothetical protein
MDVPQSTGQPAPTPCLRSSRSSLCGLLSHPSCLCEVDYHTLPVVDDTVKLKNYPKNEGKVSPPNLHPPRSPGLPCPELMCSRPRFSSQEICKHWEDEKCCPFYDKHAKCCFAHPDHEQIPMIRPPTRTRTRILCLKAPVCSHAGWDTSPRLPSLNCSSQPAGRTPLGCMPRKSSATASRG